MVKAANFRELLVRRVLKSPIVLLMLFASLLLGGCVDYDLGVNFAHTNKGQIVQSIKLAEQVTELSGATFSEWLDSVQTRATELGGKAKRIDDRELKVSIPFNNGTELEQKFNQFFNPNGKQEDNTATAIPEISSLLTLNQGNFLLAVRNQLSYDLDLRSLANLSANNTVVIDPSSLVEIEFSLHTPWGASSVGNGENTVIPASLDEGHQLTWHLQAGKINHLETVFWLPSPLGIGGLVIALLVAGGIFVKEKVLGKKSAIAKA